MQETNLDVNLIIQSFQERISQLITEVVIKEATIKQLLSQVQRVQTQVDDFETPTETVKRVK